MANVVYPLYKTAAYSGGANVSLTTGTVKALLVDLADYTYSAAHEFLSDVPAGARVATSPALSSKTLTGGVFDAADVAFTAVTGDQSEALILFIDTGSAATSRLLAFLDTGVTGLPVTPNGGDVNVTWNAGGILQL